MIDPINEKIIMEVMEEILTIEHFQELEELDTMLAMSVLTLIEDGIRLYHQKNVNAYIKEMDDHLSKL